MARFHVQRDQLSAEGYVAKTQYDAADKEYSKICQALLRIERDGVTHLENTIEEVKTARARQQQRIRQHRLGAQIKGGLSGNSSLRSVSARSSVSLGDDVPHDDGEVTALVRQGQSEGPEFETVSSSVTVKRLYHGQKGVRGLCELLLEKQNIFSGSPENRDREDALLRQLCQFLCDSGYVDLYEPETDDTGGDYGDDDDRGDRVPENQLSARIEDKTLDKIQDGDLTWLPALFRSLLSSFAKKKKLERTVQVRGHIIGHARNNM